MVTSKERGLVCKEIAAKNIESLTLSTAA